MLLSRRLRPLIAVCCRPRVTPSAEATLSSTAPASQILSGASAGLQAAQPSSSSSSLSSSPSGALRCGNNCGRRGGSSSLLLLLSPSSSSSLPLSAHWSVSRCYHPHPYSEGPRDGDAAPGAAHASSASSSSSSSAYDQFQQQRQTFHRHSFHEKGSTHKRRRDKAQQQQQEGGNSEDDDDGAAAAGGGGGGGGSGGDYGYAGPDAGTSRAQQFGGAASSSSSSTTATTRERRDISHRWENAFFGRVHFEDGMHDRFQRAIDAEEHERLAGKTNAELFPNWSPDEEAPMHLFNKLSPAMQLRYITNRLSMGERRIRYAPDYGSLSMMYQLNLGERMVREAEELLRDLGAMTEELQEKIDEVKAMAMKVKYDYDLD